MGPLTIGKLAREAGVGVETVRFYEREGLVVEPPRGASGYRHYAPETVTRLQFIRHAKELGFSLAEIRELLSLRASPEASCDDVRRQIRGKIAAVQEKRRALARLQRVLEELAETCVAGAPSSECQILEALERVPHHG
ncbi:MAG: MerR family transcriptional regulator [Thermoanaerobaculia bacterium]